ncbi:MAG TPA: hypothetical protein VFL64_12555 [Rhizobacter sp.]|nr:hypothetical protein [Rhizobacter sp.]
MQRRRFLQLGLGAAAALAVAGGGFALLQPGLQEGRLTEAGRAVFSAVARAVLDGSLPADDASRTQAMRAHLNRLDDTLSAFPQGTQSELSQLLALLAAAPGRLALTGLAATWEAATVPQIQQALQGMRISSLGLKQQAYHALRDLTNAAYYADPSTWPLLGYPGPRVQ